jgi:hypothetical protein
VPVLRMEIVKRSDDMNGIVGLPVAGWSSALSPGLGEVATSPKTSRTFGTPEIFVTLAAVHSPSDGSPGRRL